MKKISFLFALSLICGCSSFGIRTSTQIPYLQTGDHAQITIHMDGSIPGAGVESTVPINIDKIVAEVLTRLNNQESTPPSNDEADNPIDE